MNLKKAVARSVAAVSASALPLALTAAPASAETVERYQARFEEQVRFPGPNGDHTCTVIGEVNLRSESDAPAGPFDAYAVTWVHPREDPVCANATLDMQIRYEDPDGDGSFETTQTRALTDRLTWWGTTGRDVTVRHYVYFWDCVGPGAALCDFEWTTKPK